MEQVEEGEEFMVEEGHAGPEKRVGRGRPAEQSRTERGDDVDHVERADTLGHRPAIATREVETRVGRCAAHGLETSYLG